MLADLHQDLLSHVDAREVFGDVFQTSVEAIERSPVRLLIASTFNMHEGAREVSPRIANYSLELMGRYRLLGQRSGWRQVLGADDLDDEESIRFLVGVEGIQALRAPIEEELASWWGRGVRSVGPMWNLDNGIGGGPFDPQKPLSELGRRAVRWIDQASMLLDVSHMGERTFWDTLESSSGLVIATHANARALCEHPRNLTDDQIRAVAERGGVIGLVLSKTFLGLSQDLEAVLRHADHIAALVGLRHLAIGSDLGGLMDLVEKVPGVEFLFRLSAALREAFDAEAADVTYGNALRAMRLGLDQ